MSRGVFLLRLLAFSLYTWQKLSASLLYFAHDTDFLWLLYCILYMFC